MDKIYLKNYEHYISEESLVNKIATFIYVEASHETTTGNWVVNSEEIAETLDIPEELVWLLNEKIVAVLESTWKEQIAEVETYKDGDMICFDITLYYDFVYGFVEDDACWEDDEEEDE
jgi:hypothetical protein